MVRIKPKCPILGHLEIDGNFSTDDGRRTTKERLKVGNMKNTLVLNYVGKDSFNRPVYENASKLFVDVEPRKGKEPKICTVLNNVLGGEPDTPIEYIKKYQETEIEFFPNRVTW